MITYVRGNLFESPARVLVNTVNTVGVMGKGIAKEFKRLFPEMFREYQKHCETKKLTIGRLWLYKTPNKWVLNFPTKTTWREPSQLSYVEEGLKTFVKNYADRGIDSIAFPPLGCGNGELSWETQVQPLMDRYLKNLPIDIFIHLYDAKSAELPEHREIENMSLWLKSEPESLGFEEVKQDIVDMVGTRGSTVFVGERGAQIFVHLSSDGMGLVVESRGTAEVIMFDDLAGAWDSLRQYGYLMKSNSPAILEPHFDVLVAVFGKLNYCKKVDVSSDYGTLNSGIPVAGIQLIPPSERQAIFQSLPGSVKAV